MKTITYTAARENLAKTMQRVCDDHDPVVVTRKRDQAVVVMSLEDYASKAVAIHTKMEHKSLNAWVHDTLELATK
jgi:prevent-host-death family protein